MATTTPKQQSGVEIALSDAREDLENASWPGIMGFVLNPVRDNIAGPLLGVAQVVVPAVTNKIPFADPLAGTAIRLSTGAAKIVYGVFPHAPSVEEHAVKTVHLDAQPAIALAKARYQAGNPFSNAVTFMLGVAGFGFNSLLDVLTAPGEKFGDWASTLVTFGSYLVHTGVSTELEKAFWTPRVADNIRLLAEAQKSLGYGDGIRRGKTLATKSPFNQADEKKILEEAKM